MTTVQAVAQAKKEAAKKRAAILKQLQGRTCRNRGTHPRIAQRAEARSKTDLPEHSRKGKICPRDCGGN